jgi:UDP-N-acetylglucosamine 2-epimerase (non-hydrolysing)
MKILFCLGTRPEWLKIKPLINLMDKSEYDLFFTGQHEDLLNNVEFDYKVSVTNKNNRLDDIMISCMSNFPNENYDYVLVQGDTGSALGCALASYNRKIKLIHLEAGLRTYDLENPYPEEAYRQIISRISDINLCPTNLSFENLISEKVTGKIFVVGNTVLDNIVNLKDKTNYGNDVLITLHRRENHNIMDKWFESLNEITEKYKELNFILPIHPNPNVQKYKHILNKNIKVVDPLNHNNLLNILVDCRFVITDSGGIQEEATFLNKKSIVCRKTTERPEGINTGHIILCENPSDLISYVDNIVKDYNINTECPYGDGRSSEKILKIIREW